PAKPAGAIHLLPLSDSSLAQARVNQRRESIQTAAARAESCFFEMSDEMPAHIRWQLRNFHPGFLDLAFTKQFLSRFNCFADFRCVMCLRNRDKIDIEG